MAAGEISEPRVRVDGKFFRRGDQKLHIKGVTYGPFAPNAQGEFFASPEQTVRDFELVKELGANLLRIYYVPPRWFLDLAAKHRLLLFVDIPWYNGDCFLDSAKRRESIRDAISKGVSACARHPAIFAFGIGNEIPSEIVRWSGQRAIADFIDELVSIAKRLDPECLCTYTNFPPTEFLRPQSPDFACFNVYLHNPQAFKNYLAHLQIGADSKPLLLGEMGVDSIREGEAHKCRILSWQIESAFRGGVAGAIVYSFTDDWFKDGRQVEDWQLGVTTRERQPKESFHAVREQFQNAPHFPLHRLPKVSVVVACYNGQQTLKTCLESLERLNYPDYEIILVDDGSTDGTRQIATAFGTKSNQCKYAVHKVNLGLSVARNTGIAMATGHLVAFTDADCRADQDWLYYLVAELLEGEFAGVGGPNLLPPEDSPVAAAVLVSPGGPAHVMLDDREAEHIPGCNMAFWKSALLEIGSFDPIFTRAGDDVDLCWRLQQAGYKIGFVPAAFVWHYRRSTVQAYLKQQHGYGEAEALLVRKHPEYFNSLGGGIWRGRIYGASNLGVMIQPPVIYHGIFGTALFQAIYSSQPALTLMLFTMLEYHLLVAVPLWILSLTFHYLLPVAVAALLIPIGVCAAAGWQAELPKNKLCWWSRAMVALLFFLQPIVRGWARRIGRLQLGVSHDAARQTLDSVTLQDSAQNLETVQYWTTQRIERVQFIRLIVEQLDKQGWPNRTDVGWSEYDIEIQNHWNAVQLTTVCEEHRAGWMIRCRLQTRWSLSAKVAVWFLLGINLLAYGLLRHWSNWSALLLLTLPISGWALWKQKRALQSVVVVFLDQLAKGRGFSKANPPEG
jgi:GT2 family glycosyltransferase